VRCSVKAKGQLYFYLKMSKLMGVN